TTSLVARVDPDAGVAALERSLLSGNGGTMVLSAQTNILTPAGRLYDAFAYDVGDGGPPQVSGTPPGAPPPRDSPLPLAPADGRRAVFRSNATNLTADGGAADAGVKLFVVDPAQPAPAALVSFESPTNYWLSADGAVIALQTQAPLDPRDGNGDWDLYAYD